MKKLRWGVIGAGGIADRRTIPGMMLAENAELIAVTRAVFAVSRDRRNALSSWRVSLSHRTTEEDLRGFLAAFDRCYRGLTETK